MRGRTLLARLVSGAELIVIRSRSRTSSLPSRPSSAPAGVDIPRARTFGDCLTHATAKLADEPLLCLGNDFARTDLEIVRAEAG